VSVPRLPGGLLRGERPGDAIEIGQISDVERIVDGAQPRLVREQRAYGDRRLAVLRELGPVPGDRLVVVEKPARVRDRHRDRGHPLGR